MNTIIIIIGVLVLLIILVKMKEMRHHLFYKIFGLILLVFVGSIVYVWIKSGVSLKTYDGFVSLGKTYFSWIGSAFGNFGKITGFAVDQQWALNSTTPS